MIEQDVGLGTAFERRAIYGLLHRWLGHCPIRTAAEGPIDGMAGLPGLHLLPLAQRGVRVTVVQPSSEEAAQVTEAYRAAGGWENLETLVGAGLPLDRTFDLVLSFNALATLPNWRAYLEAQVSRTERWALILVTNPASYGVWLRRLIRRFEGRPARIELFDHEATRPEVIRRELSSHGRIVEAGYVDCPWWPDLFVSAGQTLAGDLLHRLPGLGGAGQATGPAPRFVFQPGDFPYRTIRGPRELERALRIHPGFEGAPRALGRLFAHHQAYLLDVA